MVYGPYNFKCRFKDTNYLLFMIVLLRIRYVLFRLLEDHWTQHEAQGTCEETGTLPVKIRYVIAFLWNTNFL